LGRFDLSILDSIHEDGPKLVELPETQVASFEAAEPELRLDPIRHYRLATSLASVPARPTAAASGPPLRVTIVGAATGQPLRGALVRAYTSFVGGSGDECVTDSKGTATLRLGGTLVALEKLYVSPPLEGYWGRFQANASLRDGDTLRLEPIQSSTKGVIGHFFGRSPVQADASIVVGIVDAGVGPHPDLSVVGGHNAAQGEFPHEYGDNGLGHGTHVAGIAAGSGSAFLGVAPRATLRSYRVCAQGQAATTNYAIVKALIYAADDTCDIVNLSLEGDSRPDQTLSDAFGDARRQGMLVVMAAGNEFRSPIGYPAYYVDHIGFVVGALGRDDCFPPGSCETANPVGIDPHDFVAPFTNVSARLTSGARIALIGPGVGVVSTVPGGYGVMSGTSMAAPAITGMAVRLLTQDLASSDPIIRRPRDDARAKAMLGLIEVHARSLGFAQEFEGAGIPL
jgi:subtilisin